MDTAAGLGPVTAHPLAAIWLLPPSGANGSGGLARESGDTLLREIAGPGILLLADQLPRLEPRQWDKVTAGVFHRRTVDVAPGTSDEIESAYVLSVRLYVPDVARREDVRRWLDDEHSAAMLAIDGAHWYAGYESHQDDPAFSFLNLWGLDHPAVIDTEAWATARDTPWRARLLDAFVRIERAVYEPTTVPS